MDMSFVDDPEWIKRRKKLWRLTLKNTHIADEISPKQLEGLQHYFMTGEVKNGEPIALLDRLKLFPVINIESIQYVLKHNYPKSRGDEANFSELMAFIRGAQNAVGVSLDEALNIFHHAFGFEFDENWTIPFLLDDEEVNRVVSLDPHIPYKLGLKSVSWLTKTKAERNIWACLMDYWFSTINHVNPVVFRPGERAEGFSRSVLKHLHYSIWRLMGCCAHNMDVTNGSAEGAERREYMCKFRNKMESISGPPDLITLWDKAKATPPEKFLEKKMPWER